MSLPSRSKYQIKIEDNRPKEFDIFPIPIDLPKYRLKNVRSKFQQRGFLIDEHNQELLKNFENPKKFFDKEESRDVQRVQHKLLQNVYNQEGLYDAFKGGETPLDPLVITIDGFVISGNRRLAIFRDLYSKDADKYHYLKEVKAIFVPYPNNSEAVKKKYRFYSYGDAMLII